MRKYVAVTSSCWIYTGGLADDGYGRFWASDLDGTRSPVVRPSRWMWEAYNGPIAAGLLVRHRCDRSICARPECLLLGFPIDNAHDTASRDRITNMGYRVSKADRRGQRDAARALRTAILAAVGAGVYAPQALASVMMNVHAAGDPHGDQTMLF
ncbi:hypothetical protein [Streptomyces kronopolitis]